ncbi:hypothetical protein EW145_g5353 [Phellinidium pouzarii]|uniref:Uncharacterized protein n=1 Tax=Phellinidium pouzarii TaxID=167371 RepID=A0A4S4L241_9AGAM|nr:hypothetical protein EW145_g5353 [Phellinidium pouzarii]
MLALLALVLAFTALFVSPSAAAVGLAPRYGAQGTIGSPANGTNIMPGAPFAFLYTPRSDYCLVSNNFTVWLLTSPPSSPFGGDMTGHFFGRFAYSTFDPAPSQLTMPDFSQSGAFSAGANASAQPMYFAVLEEWGSCDPALGSHFSLAANHIIYNGTTAAT